MTDEYTLSQAADYLGVSLATLMKYRKAGELIADRVMGRNLLFNRATLDALAQSKGWQTPPGYITVTEMMDLTGLNYRAIHYRLNYHRVQPALKRRGSATSFYDRREVERKFLNSLLDNK